MAEEQQDNPGGVEPDHTEPTDRSPDQPADQPTGDVIDASAAAEQAVEGVAQGVAALGDDATEATGPLELPELGAATTGANADGIDLLSDVNVNVRIELGRTEMLVEDVLRLGEGAVVELDKLAGDPVDIFVNDRPVARGEVLVLNDNFCVRVNEILSPAKGAEEKHGA
jgi:flagellar motor switch protein FliN/FliY